MDFQDAVAELSRVAEESLMSISTVRALGAEERETNLFEKRYQQNVKLHLDGRKPMRSSFINRTLEFGKC